MRLIKTFREPKKSHSANRDDDDVVDGFIHQQMRKIHEKL